MQTTLEQRLQAVGWLLDQATARDVFVDVSCTGITVTQVCHTSVLASQRLTMAQLDQIVARGDHAIGRGDAVVSQLSSWWRLGDVGRLLDERSQRTAFIVVYGDLVLIDGVPLISVPAACPVAEAASAGVAIG